MAKETVKVMVTVKLAAAAQSEPPNQHSAIGKHKKHK
jgi:hypothetical protein